jgi:putative membrane protein
MVEPERVPELLRKVDDSIDLPGVVWEPIAYRAWKRVFRRWAVVALIAAVPPTLLASPWASAVIVPFFLGAYFHARLYVKHSAYSLASWGLLWKSGWFNRTLKLVHYDKIQTVAQRESPFDRRNRMAAVLIDTAGGEMTGHTIAIPYLERAVAEEIARRLYLESSHRAFHW